MNEIKNYKELVAITLKDGQVITTNSSLEQVSRLFNSQEFIVIGDIGFHRFEVKKFEKFNPTEIDNFIYSQPKDIQSKLIEIINERKQKNLKTNGTKHLRDIYLNRNNENENTGK